MSHADKSPARLEQMVEDSTQSIHQLWAVIEMLVDILQHAGITNPGHRKLVERLERGRPAGKRVRLAVYEDKYAIPDAGIDCAARLHLCRARCCSFNIPLSRQDLEEGGLKWEIEEPYVMRRDNDGYCTYIDRASGGCTSYDNRPAVCRRYDCRDDGRVWKDFDAMIPADMPSYAREFPGK